MINPAFFPLYCDFRLALTAAVQSMQKEQNCNDPKLQDMYHQQSLWRMRAAKQRLVVLLGPGKEHEAHHMIQSFLTLLDEQNSPQNFAPLTQERSAAYLAANGAPPTIGRIEQNVVLRLTTEETSADRRL